MGLIVNAEQMKAAEQSANRRGINTQTLASNAAAACFVALSQVAARGGGNIGEQTAAVLCGRGMNGGDGLLLASHLHEAGVQVLCIFPDGYPRAGLSGDIFSRLSGTLACVSLEDGIGLSSQEGSAVKQALKNSDIIADCIFGTGFHGELPLSTSETVQYINENCRCLKVSVDIPSGAGSSLMFEPNITLVLGAYKDTLFSLPASGSCGQLILLDIGLNANDFADSANLPRISDYAALAAARPPLRKFSHKGTKGRLLNIAGNERFPGAALLSTKAAIRTGAGLVALAASEQVIRTIAAAIPEGIFIAREQSDKAAEKAFMKTLAAELESGRYDAIMLGCGLGDTIQTRKTVEFVINNASCPIILDADGINAVCDNINVLSTARHEVPLILTPHPGEFSRLTGLAVAQIQSNRLEYARLFAKEAGVILVLKGADTVIASPDSRVYVNPTGNPGLAKAGTGDVLTGVIGALVAGGTPPFEAAALGAYLHGFAADELAKRRCLHGITASDVAEQLGELRL
ncbi:MAG: NAD(P)H-hydrate dehydratase [Oscillospiraceae bacterium]|nr:NAD(P)H-hydrate dehydratase [Oscillospiraceae bacterium]